LIAAVSRRSAIAMSEPEITAFLETHWSCVLGSHGPQGHPHLATLSYTLVDGRLAFTAYSRSQKIVNLLRDPRSSVLVEDVGETYDEIRGVSVRGRAELSDDPDLVATVMAGVSRQIQRSGRPVRLDNATPSIVAKRTAATVIADRVLSWDHTRLGGRY
jgi:nitroimidazol reductase NimA-like FMN-containing flavoprotein (pyridoxamine 5'-phosphate oxidase superfamily)